MTGSDNVPPPAPDATEEEEEDVNEALRRSREENARLRQEAADRDRSSADHGASTSRTASPHSSGAGNGHRFTNGSTGNDNTGSSSSSNVPTVGSRPTSAVHASAGTSFDMRKTALECYHAMQHFTGTGWENFSLHFDRIIRMGHWTDEENVALLITKLKGIAAKSLDVQPHRSDFNSLKKRLQMEFGSLENDVDIASRDLGNARQLANETIREFGQRISGYLRRVYGDNMMLNQKRGINRFCNQLRSDRLRTFMENKASSLNSVDEAVTMAVTKQSDIDDDDNNGSRVNDQRRSMVDGAGSRKVQFDDEIEDDDPNIPYGFNAVTPVTAQKTNGGPSIETIAQRLENGAQQQTAVVKELGQNVQSNSDLIHKVVKSVENLSRSFNNFNTPEKQNNGNGQQKNSNYNNQRPSRGGYNGGSNGKPRFTGECFRCGRIGHREQQCFVKIECENCHMTNHISKNCKNMVQINAVQNDGKRKRLYCYGCNLDGYTTQNCPNCNPKSSQVFKSVNADDQDGGSSQSKGRGRQLVSPPPQIVAVVSNAATGSNQRSRSLSPPNDGQQRRKFVRFSNQTEYQSRRGRGNGRGYGNRRTFRGRGRGGRQ